MRKMRSFSCFQTGQRPCDSEFADADRFALCVAVMSGLGDLDGGSSAWFPATCRKQTTQGASKCTLPVSTVTNDEEDSTTDEIETWNAHCGARTAEQPIGTEAQIADTDQQMVARHSYSVRPS